MTTEEKAKAYLEDLKKAKDLLEKIFTELKESEDERIRKELLAVINDLILPEEQRARFNTWLEKQKEKKSAEWSEEDEKRVKQLIYDTEHIRAEYEKRKKELGESFNDELIKDCDEQIAWLKSLKPQPKQDWIKEQTKK